MTVGALPVMDVAVGPGSPIHVAYGIDGTWLHATGEQFFDFTVEDASSYVRYLSKPSIPSIQFSLPVIYPGAVLGTLGGTASSCLTGACYAYLKGLGF